MFRRAKVAAERKHPILPPSDQPNSRILNNIPNPSLTRMQTELARLRLELTALNAELSLALNAPETPAETINNTAQRAARAAENIAARRANFMALSRPDLAGAPPPPVALSDTETACRNLGGHVHIHSASATRICSGIDQANTFRIIAEEKTFTCRGLFRHVRQCNLQYNRAALNSFLCAEQCPNHSQAKGIQCASTSP